VATALVVTQGLMYGLSDLPELARDAGFVSFAAWLVAAFWSLWATAERAGPRPWRPRAAARSAWCVVPAVLGLALYLVAAGDAVVFPSHGGDNDSADTVAIRWTAENGVLGEKPENSEIAEKTADVAFSVVDPGDPTCSTSHYDWSIVPLDSGGRVPPIDAEQHCRATASGLPKNGRYRVTVKGKRAGDPVTGEQDFRLTQFVILSLGDSVASGEGNPGEPPNVWRDSAGCHRSLIAGPRQAARLLQRADRHVVVAFVHLACTGAWIDGGGGPPKFIGNHPSVLPSVDPSRQIGKKDEVAQANELLDGQRPDLVLLSVGANDIGFASIIRRCFKRTRCQTRGVPGFRGSLADLVKQRLRTLAASYEKLGDNPLLGERERVFITEYFDPLRGADGELCRRIVAPIHLGSHLVLDEDEIRWAAGDVLEKLNVEVANAKRAQRWNLVGGISAAFRRHGYCAGKESWIVPLPRLLKLNKGNLMMSFHPNGLGQELYGERIAEEVRAKGMFPRPDGD
jgi:lysophospholipase L1-like esterase